MMLRLLILIFSSLLSLSISASYVEDFISSDKLSNLTDTEEKQLRDEVRKLFGKQSQIFEESQKVFKSVTRKSKLNVNVRRNETFIFEQLPHSSFIQDENAVILETRKSFKKAPLILSRLSANNFLVEESGELLLLNEEKLFPLTVLNIWTKSISGCSCSDVFNPSGCACCENGGCVCHSHGNVCVKCGQELNFKQCSEHLTIKYVGTFLYKNGKSEAKQIVLIGGKKTIKFFDYNQDKKTLKEVENEGDQPIFANDIETLKYEEFLSYDLNGLLKRRLLFVFSELGASNTCFEILVDEKRETFALRNVLEWSRKGTNFDVVDVDGRILIGFIYEKIFHLERVMINRDAISINKFHSFTEFSMDLWYFFTTGRSNVFLLQGKDLVKIYIYDKETFSLLQDIPVKDLFKVINISNYGSNGLLLFIFSDRIVFYSQDKNKKYINIMIQKFEEKYFLKSAKRIFIKDIPHFLIEHAYGSDLFRLNLVTEKKEEEPLSNSLINKFRDLKSRFDYQLQLLDKIEDEIHSGRRIKTIVEDKIAAETKVDRITSLKTALDTLDKDIKNIKESLVKLQISLKDVVPRSGTKKTITGTKYFYGRKTSIDELVVTHARTGTLLKNKGPLSKIIQNLVQINDDHPIEGRKIFGGKIRVENLHTSTLNGKDMENFITANKPAEIEGGSYVNGIYVKNDVFLHPNSEVFGRDLSEDLLSLNGNNELGNCHFDNVKIVGGISVETDIVNSGSFKALTRSFLKSEGNISLPGAVTFSNLTVKGNLDARSVMGVDKSVLLSEIISKFENQTLSNVKFTNSIHCDNLDANKINGEVFPDEFVTKSGSWINFGRKSFNKINFIELSVGGYVDYIKTSDLVTKSTPQMVLGTKTFARGIKVLGNLNIVASSIDGVDISVLASNANQKVDKNVVIFLEEVTAPGVIVKGSVNNLALEKIANDLVYKDKNETRITGRKVFLQDLIINKSCNSAAINKIDFSTFVNTGKKNSFSSKTTFTDVVNFDNIKVNGLIDNTNLTKLVAEVVLLDKPYQVVTGDKHFETMSVNHLEIEKLLNHKSVDELLTKSTDQVFSGDIILNKAIFENLSVTNVNFFKNGTLNGINIFDIKKAFQNAENLDAELIVEGNVIIKKELCVDELNQFNVNGLYDLFLKTERHQIVKTDVISFRDLEIQGAVTTTDYAMGNATLLKKNAASALKTYEKNNVNGNMWWESINASEMNVNGMINGIKLYKLHEDLVYLNDPNTFSVKAPKYFLNGFHVFGDVETNSINGRDLRKQLFSKTTRQVIRSPASFGRIIAQNINLKTFNGVQINKFKNAKKREKSLIVAPSPFKGFVHISNLKLTGRIGQENILATFNDAIDVRQKKIVISGKKTFTQSPTFTTLNVATLNSEHLKKRKVPEFTLNFLTVNGTISALNLKADNLRTKNRSSLLSPSHLRNTFVLAKDIFGSLKFDDFVIKGNVVASKINGEILDEKFLTRNTNQSVWFPTNISSMFTKDVYVYGAINGFRIPNDTFAKEKIKIIEGSVHNETITIPASLFVKGKFGKKGLVIPHDLIFLNKKNRVEGLVSFVAPLVTTYIESTDQTLNGIELSILDAHLRSYRDTFKENIVSKSNVTNSYVGSIEAILKKECQKTSLFQSLLTNVFVQPHSFKFVSKQEFNNEKYVAFDQQSASENVPILIYKSAFNHWMINSVHFGSCETKVLQWNKTLLKFEGVRSLGNLGNVRQWMKLDAPNFDTVYFLAISSGKGNCGLKESSLWKANHTSLTFEKIQEIEAASRAFILPGVVPYIYLDVGYKLTLWTFTEGLFEKIALEAENQKPVLRALKSFDKPDGGKITIQYYENMLDIIDDRRRRILFMPNVKDIFVMTHFDDILFIISKMQNGLRGKQFYVEIHLYKDLNLQLLTSESLKEPNVILPLDIPDDDSDTEMLFALTGNFPRVYRLGGEPFMTLWSEFPGKLNGNVLWAFQFIDSKNNAFLTYGDDANIINLRLEKEGKKFDGKILK